MDVLRLRTLTRKSVHGFGYSDYKDLSMQQLLDLRKHNVIIKAYFGLDRINYIDDILEECGITEDIRIDKPGKLRGKPQTKAVRQAFINMYANKTEIELMAASQKAKKRRRLHSKNTNIHVSRLNNRKLLQSRNQGKR